MASTTYFLNITIRKETDKSTFTYVIPNVEVHINDGADLNEEIDEAFPYNIDWEEVE